MGITTYPPLDRKLSFDIVISKTESVHRNGHTGKIENSFSHCTSIQLDFHWDSLQALSNKNKHLYLLTTTWCVYSRMGYSRISIKFQNGYEQENDDGSRKNLPYRN